MLYDEDARHGFTIPSVEHGRSRVPPRPRAPAGGGVNAEFEEALEAERAQDAAPVRYLINDADHARLDTLFTQQERALSGVIQDDIRVARTGSSGRERSSGLAQGPRISPLGSGTRGRQGNLSQRMRSMAAEADETASLIRRLPAPQPELHDWMFSESSRSDLSRASRSASASPLHHHHHHHSGTESESSVAEPSVAEEVVGNAITMEHNKSYCFFCIFEGKQLPPGIKRCYLVMLEYLDSNILCKHPFELAKILHAYYKSDVLPVLKKALPHERHAKWRPDMSVKAIEQHIYMCSNDPRVFQAICINKAKRLTYRLLQLCETQLRGNDGAGLAPNVDVDPKMLTLAERWYRNTKDMYLFDPKKAAFYNPHRLLETRNTGPLGLMPDLDADEFEVDAPEENAGHRVPGTHEQSWDDHDPQASR